MMTSLPEALGMALTSFISGVMVGQFVRFRRVDDGGRRVLKPELDRRPFKGRWFRLGIVLLFLTAVGLTVQTTATQRLCNEEFRRTIALRADIAADDNAARKAQDQAVADLVAEITAAEIGEGDRARVALHRYLDQVAGLNGRQVENERQRAANPYPSC